MRHVVYDVSGAATAICWVLFAIVWIAGAVIARRRGPAVARREERNFASSGAAVAALIVLATPASLWRDLSVGSPWIRVAGLVLLLPSTAGALWARAALGDMWSAAVVTKERHALRTSGPYRITRHPIYTAILGMVAGSALTQGLGRSAALFVVVAAFLAFKIRAEERLLSREFAAEYDRYRQEVPRLIPGLRPRRGQ